MMKRILMTAVLLMGVAGYAYASDTATQSQVTNPNYGWVSNGDRNTVLLIESTTSSLEQALTDTYRWYREQRWL